MRSVSRSINCWSLIRGVGARSEYGWEKGAFVVSQHSWSHGAAVTCMHLGEFYTLWVVCEGSEGGKEAPHASWKTEQVRGVWLLSPLLGILQA